MPLRQQPINVSRDELGALRRQDRARRELNNWSVQSPIPLTLPTRTADHTEVS